MVWIFSTNNYDTIEKLIYDEGLRIEALDFHIELDLMLIILNSKAVLNQKISNFKQLKNSSINELQQYRFISNGNGVHWAKLDEDLSLKGFLRDELRMLIGMNKSDSYAA